MFSQQIQHVASPTWSEVVREYLASSQYRGLADSSREAYKAVLKRWVRDNGLSALQCHALTSQELERHLSRLTQGAANFMFKRVRVLIRFAIVKRYRGDDPHPAD